MPPSPWKPSGETHKNRPESQETCFPGTLPGDPLLFSLSQTSVISSGGDTHVTVLRAFSSLDPANKSRLCSGMQIRTNVTRLEQKMPHLLVLGTSMTKQTHLLSAISTAKASLHFFGTTSPSNEPKRVNMAHGSGPTHSVVLLIRRYVPRSN